MLIQNNSTARGYSLGSVFIPPGEQRTVPDAYYDEILGISDLKLIGSVPPTSAYLIPTPTPVRALVNTDGSFGGLATTANMTLNAPSFTTGTNGLMAPGVGNIPLALTSRGRCVFIGDSLTYGGSPGRAPGYFSGIPYYGSSTVTTPANLGSGAWLVYVMVDGRAGTAGGTVETDSRSWMRWTYTGDTPGEYVDVSQGGWFYLNSGTPNKGILVAIRGATAPVANGTSTVTTAGLATISEYNLLGYVAWVAGLLGDTFSDYQAYGISGATTADMVKWAPQALAQDAEVVVIVGGTNDSPATDVAATALANNIINLIDQARARARHVVYQEAPPNIAASATINKFLARAGAKVRAYIATLKNVAFSSAYDRMVNANTLVVGANAGGKTGVYYTVDNIHFMPFGAYQFALPIVNEIKRFYQTAQPYRNALAEWDPTLKIGSHNLNPCLRGSGGTVTAANGITGTTPDSYTLSRSGSTQTCTTTFEPDPDGGMDWWTMDVAGATAGDYHELLQQFNVPTGMAVGDSFQLVVEFKIFNTTGAGAAIFQAQTTSGGNIQSSYVFQTGRDVATFTTEGPALKYRSEAQKMLSGFSLFTMRLRVGARTGGGGIKVGWRAFAFERVAT